MIDEADWKTPQGFSKRIALCRKVGRWQEASYLLHRMCLKRLVPNDVACNMVISCLARKGKWQLALLVLNEMPQMKAEADLISYNSAISACEAAGEWEHTLALLEALEAAKMQPDVICYSGVISACAKGGFWRLTTMLLERLSEQRMQPDLVACNSALGAYKGCRWPMAISTLEAYTTSLRLTPDVVSFCTAISCCAEVWPKALQLLEMRSLYARLAQDVFGYSSAMSCMSNYASQAWTSTLHLLTDMLCRQVEPNHFSCSSAISSAPWSLAISILQASDWSHVCYVGALATCANALAWVAALGCLEDMLKQQIDPGPVEVGTLAEALQRAKGRDTAWQLLRSMQPAWKDELSHPQPPTDIAEILCRRPGILVANKPEGISTEQYIADLGKRLGTRLSLTSRLDFPTSGVLPLALGVDSLAGKWLQAQLAGRLVDKEYICLCEGPSLGPVGTKGLVAAKLLTTELEGHTSRSEVHPDGREARTEYEVLQRFCLEDSELILLAAHPITGRTHQIRVHFAFLGRPLLGDLTYGRRESAALCPRLFLHCRRFSCRDLSGAPLVVEAPLPAELQQVLATLSR